jgi:hypothetical protein
MLAPPRQAGAGETGTVYISIDGEQTGARTLAPDQADFARYTASFSGPGAGTPADVIITGGSASVSLAPGEWTITVTAYTYAGFYIAVGRGNSGPVQVTSGGTSPVTIIIKPIPGSGQGSLHGSVSIPAVDNALFSLTDLSTSQAVAGTPIDLTTLTGGAGTATKVFNLVPGYYLLNIRLEQSGKYAGRTEVVHIYNELTTNAECVFTDDDFSGVIHLTDGAWQDGNMPASGYKYYWFDVTLGTGYRVYWNDSFAGDGSKNLNIKVTAYYESTGSSIFDSIDSGYYAPRTFTAAQDGTVIIKAESWSGDTGTYAVKYVANQTEAAVFRYAHSAILAKTVGNIAIADGTAVDAALSDYTGLFQAVQDLLAAEKTLLDSLKAKIITLGVGSITLIYPTDAAGNALTDTSIAISKSGGIHTLLVNGSFDSYRWRVDGSARGSGETFILNPGDYALGTHQISLELTLNGAAYSKSGSFTVTP